MELLSKAKKIAEGYSTLIYLTELPEFEREVIIKVLKEEFNHFPNTAQITNEFQQLKELNIENVRKVLSVEERDNRQHLLLEYFKGTTLGEAIKSGNLSTENKLNVCISICKALAAIHDHHLIHKDINSANILINDKFEINVIDFGLTTKFHIKQGVRKISELLEGTLPYIAPEQTGRMNMSVDHRADLYSFGVVLYELFTGLLPFDFKDPMELVHAHLAIKPKAPQEVNQNIPSVISDIVLKLLAKNVEKRYQSAHGLLVDFEKCLSLSNLKLEVSAFEIGLMDHSTKFLIPSRLYGRDAEVKKLLNSFENIGSDKKEITLIEGISGTGKTSLVYEVHKPITQKKGIFIHGKHEQYQKDIPYFAIAQAMKVLVDHILSEQQEALENWKKSISKALGNEGKLITDLIPSLELIIGEQADLDNLGLVEARHRFNYTFLKFIKAISSPYHPIVLFVDDLQWADYASLQLLEKIILAEEIKYFYFIGAYRNNEISETHPAALTFQNLANKGVHLNKIKIAELSEDYVDALIQDTLPSHVRDTRELTEIVFRKTGGNPFFVNQFLKSMYEQELIYFDYAQKNKLGKKGAWDWNIDQLQQMNFTDNVVEFMIGKINNLINEEREILKLASCIGDKFDLRTLQLISDLDPKDMVKHLWAAIKEQLIIQLDGYEDLGNVEAIFKHDSLSLEDFTFRFAHDRIRQASYELIAPTVKAPLHRKIGNVFLDNFSEAEKNEKIFDIVFQLNLGRRNTDDSNAELLLTRLNYQAGKKAKSATAYASAVSYFEKALSSFDPNLWKLNFEFSFEFHRNYIESAFLKGDYDLMEEVGYAVIEKCENELDVAVIKNIFIHSFIARNRHAEVIDTGVKLLKTIGVKLPAKGTKFNLLSELVKTKFLLRNKKPEFFRQKAFTEDAKLELAINILSSISTGAYHNNPELFPIAIFKTMQLSVKYGNSVDVISFYGGYGTILCAVTGEIDLGFDFGVLSLNLLEDQAKSKPIASKTKVIFTGFINHWKRHLRESIPMLEEAFLDAMESGDPQYAASSLFIHSYHLFLMGNDLNQILPKVKSFDKKIEGMKQEAYALYSKISVQRMENLNQNDALETALHGDIFDEGAYFEAIEKGKVHKDKTALFHIYFSHLMLHFLKGNYKEAFESSALVEPHLDIALSTAYIPVYHFLDGAAALLYYENADNKEKKKIVKKAKSSLKKMGKWASFAGMNFKHKYHILEGLYQQVIQKNEQKAQENFELAVQLATENGYIQDAAIVCELTAKLYKKNGFEDKFAFFIKRAYDHYKQWGANAKVFEFEQAYNMSMFTTTNQEGSDVAMNTINKSNSILDLAAILKSSTAISSEIKLEKVIDQLLKIVVQNAGAQNGMFLINSNNKLQHVASNAINNEVQIIEPQEEIDASTLPMSVIHFVKRTKKNMVLDSAIEDSQFGKDPYILDNKTESILCLPIVLHDVLLGMIYLENNLVKGAFTTQRLELLKLLSGQIAVTLNNAILYENMEAKVKERTQKIEVQKEELEKRNGDLKLINQEKDDLINIVSHDLRSPLNQVKGLAQLTAMSSSDKSVTEYTDKMIDATERLNQMITRILDISAIDSKTIELQIVTFDILDVFNRLIERYTNSIEEKNIQLNLHTNLSRIDILLDKSYFEQIVDNLLSNAIKFSFPDSKIDVFIEKNDHSILIEIKDFGQGISEEDQRKLFNKFQKLTAKPTGQESSTGLGLSIVKKYVETMNGKIWCESKLNKGTSFFVKFASTTRI